MLTEFIPAAIRPPLFRVGLIVSAAYLAMLGWTSGKYFLKAYATHQIYIEDLNWPVAWSWVWLPVGLFLLMLRVLLVAFGPAEGLHAEHRPDEEI